MYVEAVQPGRPPVSSLEEKQAREEELSRLCPPCLIEVTSPPEKVPLFLNFFDSQERMHAAGRAEPASETLWPLLDALETEAVREPADIAATRQRLTAILQYLASAEGRTLANIYAVSQRLSRASSWHHLPTLEREILGSLSVMTLQAFWEPESPWATFALPEQLLARLQTEA